MENQRVRKLECEVKNKNSRLEFACLLRKHDKSAIITELKLSNMLLFPGILREERTALNLAAYEGKLEANTEDLRLVMSPRRSL